MWAKNDGAENIEELASEIRQAGYPVDDIVSINGIPCVSYRVEDGDCSAIMFFHPTDQQYILCITATQYTAKCGYDLLHTDVTESYGFLIQAD